MRSPAALSLTALVAVLTACSDGANPTEPDLGAGLGAGRGRASLTVMSQNLYVGADVDAVITALATPDPADDIPALLAAVATIEHTDFPARARAIAREVGRTRPAVIGLQEVSTIGVDIPPLGVSVHLDFQQILLDALAAEGLNYQVGIRHDNFTAAPAPGISLTDADLLLYDASRVTAGAASGHTFQANLGLVAPGVTLTRGWVQMEATVDGATYTVANVHTEGTGPEAILLELHAYQVGEMAAALGAATPAVVMGDFNTTPGTPAYQVMEQAGFVDTWSALRPGVTGFTCCHVADLADMGSTLRERIDYVWSRGLGAAQGSGALRGQVTLLGDVPAERLQNGAGEWIWPSDHTGLVASLQVGHGMFP